MSNRNNWGHHGQKKHVAEMDIEGGPGSDDGDCGCFSRPEWMTTKKLSCGVCACVTITLLLLILIPISFSYVPIWKIAFKKNSLTNFVDQDDVYSNGRYFWGPQFSALEFPSVYQRIEFRGNDLMPFSKTGLEFTIECDIYYRLNAGNLSAVFGDFGQVYHDRYVNAIRASLKNTGPEFTVDQYITERDMVVQAMWENLNEELGQLHQYIEPHKFLLLRISFPDRVKNVFLNTAVQELENDKSILEQRVEVIRKETEEQVQAIQAQIEVVNRTAAVQAEAMVKEAEAEKSRILQEALGAGVSYLINELTITNMTTQGELFRLLTILDNPHHPKVLVGGGAQPLISV